MVRLKEAAWHWPLRTAKPRVAAAILLTVAAALGVVALHAIGNKTGLRLGFDSYDLNVYFMSSRWIGEGGTLYRNVPSEYPLLANVVFAAVRGAAGLLHPGFRAFCLTWMALAWLVYLLAVDAATTGAGKLVALSWLAPATIYFALYRFDIYPAAATLLALFAIRRQAFLIGAVWLGVAIALKGYALVFLPAYCVFLIERRGIGAAFNAALVAIAPLLLGLLATLLFAGWDGMLAPFKFHAVRTLNGESTYDALNYLSGLRLFAPGAEIGRIAQLLQLGCALGAAALRPRRFDELIHAFLFATLGFMTFSVFYSPQFILWILPLTCFSGSRFIAAATAALCWLTYLYFPVGFDLGRDRLFDGAVVLVAFIRIVMMVVAAAPRADRASEDPELQKADA